MAQKKSISLQKSAVRKRSLDRFDKHANRQLLGRNSFEHQTLLFSFPGMVTSAGNC